jgi:hypothetical protein
MTGTTLPLTFYEILHGDSDLNPLEWPKEQKMGIKVGIGDSSMICISCLYTAEDFSDNFSPSAL